MVESTRKYGIYAHMARRKPDGTVEQWVDVISVLSEYGVDFVSHVSTYIIVARSKTEFDLYHVPCDYNGTPFANVKPGLLKKGLSAEGIRNWIKNDIEKARDVGEWLPVHYQDMAPKSISGYTLEKPKYLA